MNLPPQRDAVLVSDGGLATELEARGHDHRWMLPGAAVRHRARIAEDVG
ncbi:hypothetical protein [Mycolicibacterium psychrotolerans]|nr:hypothetical protein [Mycolicibacterium psychrotolerans]